MSSLQGLLGNPAVISVAGDSELDNLLGQAGVRNPQDRQALVKTIKESGAVKMAAFLSPTAKDVAIRVAQFSKKVQDRYAKGEVVTRPIQARFIAKVADVDGAKKIVFVEDGNLKVKGWRDIAAAGLPSGYPFVVREIQVKAGKQATPTSKADENSAKVEFQAIDLTSIDGADLDPTIPKGKLFIKSGGQDQFLEGLPMNNFIDTPVQLQTGLYVLETPITFQDAIALEMYIETVANMPQGTFFELTLKGGGPQPVNTSNTKE